jgi:hypothetical protein
MPQASSDFFKHIANKIEALTKAYMLFAKELDLVNSKSKIKADTKEDRYKFLIERLKRAIDAFKDEMAASLNEFYFQKDNDLISPYSINHIKNSLDELKKVHRTVTKKISDQVLKDKLEHNYFFHVRIGKLTADKLMEYFELNYMLHKKQSKK